MGNTSEWFKEYMTSAVCLNCRGGQWSPVDPEVFLTSKWNLVSGDSEDKTKAEILCTAMI